MNINEVLDEYDNMFGNCSVNQIEEFLDKMICAATKEDDILSLITLLNEAIGFCRDIGKEEKGVYCCEQVIKLLDDLNMNNTIQYATTLINVGNAYRAFNLLEKSEECYKKALAIYDEKLDKYDRKKAGLYNNYSLLYQEKGDYKKAYELLNKAYGIIVLYKDTQIEQATTLTNMAATLAKLGRLDEAMIYEKKAIDIFMADGEKNYHYSGALAALGDIMYAKGEYVEAKKNYLKAMTNIEKHLGRTANYYILEENVKKVQKLIDKQKVNDSRSGSFVEKCRLFYEGYLKEAIHKDFGAYEDKIGVGITGYGSECFGFDDEYSYDHDCNVRLFLFVDKETLFAIGNQLQSEYENQLERFYKDYNIKINASLNINKVDGVVETKSYYTNILELDHLPVTDEEWYSVKEEKLAMASNGVIFTNNNCQVTDIRKYLSDYYNDTVWMTRIANEMYLYSQSAQYNYSRMKLREEYVASKMSIAMGMEHCMKLVYLLNRTYAPYYKWLRKGLEKLPVLSEIGDILDTIAINEDVAASNFELIAKLIVKEMNKMGIIEGKDTYLDHYTGAILQKVREGLKALTDDEASLIDKVISLEWKQFDKVENIDGRADCQDDFNTFNIMRRSQYMAFSEELLKSYYLDLAEAERKGWNLIAEKYARMMEYTSPAEYSKIKNQLPARDEGRLQIQEAIIEIQISMMEEFAKEYPKMAANARSIHTYEDNIYNTSYETYLRGELGTYSDETLILYGRFITGCIENNINLAYKIMNNTAVLYGYKSVEDAEAKL